MHRQAKGMLGSAERRMIRYFYPLKRTAIYNAV
jgi:hypothetical protein